MSTSHNIQNVRLFGPRRSWFGHSMAMAKMAPLQSNNFWNCLAANCGPWWVWVFFGTPKWKNSRFTFTLEERLDLLSTDPARSLFHHPCLWHQNEQMVDNNHVSFWNGLWSDERFLITILFPCFALKPYVLALCLKHTAITAHVDNQNS